MKKNKTLQIFASIAILFLISIKSNAQVHIGLSIRIGPPAIPTYVQPPCPVDGYLWTPGYWAYGPNGYYWIPGAWVAPPQPGLLWTPGYWGYTGGIYAWHAGYWGHHVGFYGGINYGFGYSGTGFVGGMWNGNVFRYNTAVVNVNRSVVRNVYVNKTVINNRNVSRVSFNGEGGVRATPDARETSYMNEHHVQATAVQRQHMTNARDDRNQYMSANHGSPRTMAVGRTSEYHATNARPQQRGNGVGHSQHGGGHRR